MMDDDEMDSLIKCLEIGFSCLVTIANLILFLLIYQSFIASYYGLSILYVCIVLVQIFFLSLNYIKKDKKVKE